MGEGLTAGNSAKELTERLLKALFTKERLVKNSFLNILLASSLNSSSIPKRSLVKLASELTVQKLRMQYDRIKFALTKLDGRYNYN